AHFRPATFHVSSRRSGNARRALPARAATTTKTDDEQICVARRVRPTFSELCRSTWGSLLPKKSNVPFSIPRLTSGVRLARASLIALAALLAFTATTHAGGPVNWPQFRGPTGQGHADGAELPVTWS